MLQTEEVNPAKATDVYPRLPSPESRLRVEDIPTYTRRPPRAHFTDGGDDVNMPQEKSKRGFPPDAIGTVTIATTSFGLMGGIPFGIPGALVGAVFGFAVGFWNQAEKRSKRST